MSGLGGVTGGCVGDIVGPIKLRNRLELQSRRHAGIVLSSYHVS